MSKIAMYVSVDISGGMCIAKTKQVTKLEGTLTPKMSIKGKMFEFEAGFNVQFDLI